MNLPTGEQTWASESSPAALTGPLSAGAKDRRSAHAAAGEFESLLLGQWLQAAETSFAAVPGGDEDQDAGGEQMKAIATQSLAKALAAKGGVGLAPLIVGALDRQHPQASEKGARVRA